MNTEQLIITSHSIDATFEACPRRFEFLHMYLKAPEHESDAFAADVGTAIHEGTQEWQRAVFSGRSAREAEEIGLFTLLKFWPWEAEAKRLVKQPGKDRIQGVGERTLGNSMLLLQAIYECPIWAEWELVSIEGFGPAIEVPWRIIHRSLGPVWMPYGKSGFFATQGKIDFILRHRATGKYKIIDLKTTQKSFPSHEASFRFSGQAGQYALVLSHALGLDWEHEGLEVTYLIAFFGDAEHDLDVYPLDYKLPPDEVRDAIDVKLGRLLRMKQYAEQKYWPRTAHGCDFWGTACGFLDICARRDQPYIEKWLEFEKAKGMFSDYHRVYEPVWTLEA